MATEPMVLAALILLGVVLVVAMLYKGDVKTSFRVPFLASFSLEAKDRRARGRSTPRLSKR